MSNTDGWSLRQIDLDSDATAQRVLEWCTETGLPPGYTETKKEKAAG